MHLRESENASSLVQDKKGKCCTPVMKWKQLNDQQTLWLSFDLLPERGDQVSPRGTCKYERNTPDRPSSHLNQYPGTKRVCGGQTDAADTPRKCSDHTTSSALWIPAQRVSPRWPTWKHLSEQATQPLTRCVGSAWRPDRPSLPPSEHKVQSVGRVSDPARDNAHNHGAWRALP